MPALRPVFRLSLLALLLAAAIPARAQDPADVPVRKLTAGQRLYRTVSPSGTTVVESPDPMASDAAAALAERYTREIVPPGGRFSRLVLRVEEQDPSVLPRDPFLLLLHGGAKPDFQVTLFVGPNNPSDGWLRCIVEALLFRRAVAMGAPIGLNGHGGLPPIPLWIAEGAFQSVVDDKQADRAAEARMVARRARFLGTTPTVETIFGWSELGDDPLLRPWRETFCGLLYLFYRTNADRTAELDGWFRTLGGAAPTPWKIDDAVEQQWRDFQRTVAGEGEVLYTWDRTAAELSALRTLVLPAVPAKTEGEKPQPARIIPWTDLARVAADPAFPPAAQEVNARLTLLEMKANFAWRPVIGLYRDALASLLVPKDAASYPSRLAVADAAAERLSGFDQRATDYLNWFEVTRQTGGAAGRGFEGYFDLSARFDLLSGQK